MFPEVEAAVVVPVVMVGNCSGPFPGGLAGYGGNGIASCYCWTTNLYGTAGETGQGWWLVVVVVVVLMKPLQMTRGTGGPGNDRTGTTPWGGGGNGAGGQFLRLDEWIGSGTGGGGGGGRTFQLRWWWWIWYCGCSL